MYNGLKITILFLFFFCCFSMPARAETLYKTEVKVIRADKGPSHVDPGIQDVVKEIHQVFKYTRFKILKEKKMSLPRGRKGRLSLPGNRTLIIVPEGMKGERIRYRIRIDTQGNPVFRTDVMLKNNSSVTIGGPRVSKGVLLLNIQGSAR